MIWKYLICGAIFLHLLLVSSNAAYIRIGQNFPLRKILQFYGKASGADSSYGFFAPSIGTKVRALFDVVDKNGAMTSNIDFASQMNREENIRMGGIFDEFLSEEIDDEEFRQQLASSLAAGVFSLHPDAVNVILHVEEYRSISMDEYREGTRSEWEEIYSARFVRTLEERTSL